MDELDTRLNTDTDGNAVNVKALRSVGLPRGLQSPYAVPGEREVFPSALNEPVFHTLGRWNLEAEGIHRSWGTDGNHDVR